MAPLVFSRWRNEHRCDERHDQHVLLRDHLFDPQSSRRDALLDHRCLPLQLPDGVVDAVQVRERGVRVVQALLPDHEEPAWRRLGTTTSKSQAMTASAAGSFERLTSW